MIYLYFIRCKELAEQIDQLLYNKNQEMQNDSKENVSLQDYIQKEAEVVMMKNY